MRVMRALSRSRSRAAEEDGYTMIAVVGAIALVSMLAAAALAATNGDINLVQRDLDRKRAHAAAQAGIADYSFHLNSDNGYWARCTNVPEPHAVNQQGSTAKRRSVPGPEGETYAIELLPATGKSQCDPVKPVESMLEQSGVNTGSFRIRSTGYSGDTEVSLVATYKRASLLDYVYFTQLETSDPVTYGTQPWSQSAYDHCSKFIREGRQQSEIPGSNPPGDEPGRYCDKIVFTTGDDIDGPLHTNDALVINGSPSFGRGVADVTEVSAPPIGWHSCSSLKPNTGCSTANPKFNGPFVTTAPVLKPPATNGKLKKIAGPSYTYFCQTRIRLEGTNMTVTTGAGTSTVPFPPDGVVYVANGACPGSSWPSCSSAYSPFTATYPSGSDCGTARVSGTYSGELTIAAENDIIVWGDILRSDTGLLGLIANNFVRVRHPFSDVNDTKRLSCDDGEEEDGFNPINRIDAALLAIDHSFIVDHYDCGDELGELEVNGAISQKYRGAVGMTGGTGYTKDYNYDDRLRYMEPPQFLDPVEPSWHIQRETLDFSG